MELFETLTALVGAYGPAGSEVEVARVIENLARPYVDEMSRDTLGNLICHKKGSGPKVMFSAHMDTIGLVVTHIEENGFLRVGSIGGVNPDAVMHTPVRFANGTRGVIGADLDSEQGKRKMSQLFIDIGADSCRSAQEKVQVGDVAVYAIPTMEAMGKFISPYMDNRISCLVLLMAMEKMGESENDLYFVFSVQEELGLRGAKTAAWGIDPDYGIAVDVTLDDSQPGTKHTVSSACGKGAAIKVMDHSVICHPVMVEQLTRLAQEKGIPAQRDIIRGGGTDAGAIHLTRTGVYTGGISIPCRYVHTPGELVDRGDVEACAKLVAAFAETKLEKEC